MRAIALAVFLGAHAIAAAISKENFDDYPVWLKNCITACVFSFFLCLVFGD
jgi:formate/nitrite transporter FocA (FNT family)